MPDKGLIFDTYEEPIHVNIKKQPDFKRTEELIDIFFQGKNADGQQACENILNVVNHQRNAYQNRYGVYYLITFRMAPIKKNKSN